MREMKDSGIDWIGEVPEDWEVRKLNDVADRITDFVASGSFASLAENVKYLDVPNYAMLVRTADISNRSTRSNIYIDKEAYDFLKNSNLFGGEIILPNIGSVGDVYMYEPMYERASLAPNSIMMDMLESNRFYYYWLLNPIVNNALKRIGSDSVQAKFNKTQLRQFRVVRPTLAEQQKIASYLDQKVAYIDNIIEKTKESIEEYKKYKQSLITETVTKGLNPDVKMKDSGIEWIGEIPEHWDVKKLKFVLSLETGLSVTKAEFVENGIPCINYGDIHSRYTFDFDINRDILNKVPYEFLETKGNSLAKNGDFIFCDTSEDIEGSGNCLFIRDNDGREVLAGSHTIIGKPLMNLYSPYLGYVLKCSAIKNQIQKSVSGIKVYSITQRILKEIKVILPTLDEQIEIGEFLDKKSNLINNFILQKEKLIKEYEVYKKALIYEVVTGKKEI